MRLSLAFPLGALAWIALVLPGHLAAQSEIELEGAISSIDGTTIKLLDGLVSVETRGASISHLKAGTVIELEATTLADGSIQATMVEVSDEADDDTEVEGVIARVDTAAQTFSIGSVTITWDGQTRFKGISGPKIGELVEARVRASGRRIVALAVERE